MDLLPAMIRLFQQIICIDSPETELISLIETSERLNILLQCCQNVFPAVSLLSSELTSMLRGLIPFNNLRLSSFGKLRRFGWIQKYSKCGYQARMAFLFHDRLIYASKCLSSFKVHGIIGLTDASIEYTPRQNNKNLNASDINSDSSRYTFAIIVKVPKEVNRDYSPLKIKRRRIIFALTNQNDRDAWVEDIDHQIVNSALYPCSNNRDEISNNFENNSSIIGFVRLSAFISAAKSIEQGSCLRDSENDTSRVRQFSSTSLVNPKINSTNNQYPWLGNTGSAWTISESCSSSRIFGPRSMGSKQQHAFTDQSDCGGDSLVQRRGISSNSVATVDESLSRDGTEANRSSSRLSGDASFNTRLHENNSIIHVCWHRQLSISIDQILVANECELSGYLLRKFKSSSGWQKLWTVLTSMTLYFYKSSADQRPLASLPLYGYRIEPAYIDKSFWTNQNTATLPVSCDWPIKSYNPKEPNSRDIKPKILCISYKTHIYYFRAENPTTFYRWFEALYCVLNGSKPRHLDLLEQMKLESSTEAPDDGNIDSPASNRSTCASSSSSDHIYEIEPFENQNLFNGDANENQSESFMDECCLSEAASETAIREDDDLDLKEEESVPEFSKEPDNTLDFEFAESSNENTANIVKYESTNETAVNTLNISSVLLSSSDNELSEDPGINLLEVPVEEMS